MTTILLLLLYLLSIIPNSNSTPNKLYSICPSTSSPLNSKYTTNLNTVLSSLTSRVTTNPPTAFYTTASGNGTSDAVYGLYFCRADQNASSCADCVTTATNIDLPNIDCPNSNVAVIWYDECIVRYSNESLLGKMATDPSSPLVDAVNGRLYEGNQTLFKDTIENTMLGLVNQTARNNSGMKFGTKSVNFTKSDTLYVLQECTPDLSAKDCAQCLNTAISKLQIVKGVQIMQPSCHIRYELFPFYGSAVNISLSSISTFGNNSTSSNQHGKKSKLIIAIVVPIVGVLLIFALGIFLIKKKAKNYEAAIPLIGSVGEDFTSLESLQYDLATLQSATSNFAYANKLGEGGFGGVYKGKLSNGQEIAVKRLSKSSGQGVEEFKNEVLLVAKLQHRRLVRLLGFSVAGDEKLLVYEYVPNKSLDHFLFDPEKKGELGWRRRYNIIKGVARGMLYLHQDSQLRIIHRDLKASNVLLDEDMNPKISDFGMAKIFGIDQTQGKTTRVVGTYGYMSPEYAMHGQFSIKSDVYSFGVLVLEIISGMKNNSFYKAGYAEDLLSYAWNQWRDGTALEFVDETIRDSCSLNEVKKCMHLGLLCVQESIDDRPTMATVVLMLDGQSVSIRMPQQPAYYTKSIESLGNYVGSDQSTVPWSMNEDSISHIEPR